MLIAGCGSTGARDLLYQCNPSAQCADKYFCHPTRKVCVADGTSVDGGSGGGGGGAGGGLGGGGGSGGGAQATGKRVRTLPIKPGDLKKA